MNQETTGTQSLSKSQRRMILEELKTTGVTQKVIAEKYGVKPHNIANWLHNERKKQRKYLKAYRAKKRGATTSIDMNDFDTVATYEEKIKTIPGWDSNDLATMLVTHFKAPTLIKIIASLLESSNATKEI